MIVLQPYDQHLNMILGYVEEVVTSMEIDDKTYEKTVKVRICFTQLAKILIIECS